MPRYIDADALRQRMYHEAFETDTDMQRWDSGCWIRYKLFENCLESMPTISTDEVRGVVHCGECKFWRRPPSCEGLARCETGETGIRYRSKNDFCSRGAKMKGAEDETTDDSQL